MRLFKEGYKSITELPIYNWNELHKTGNLSYLLKDKKPLNEFEKTALARRWVKIYDEYIKHFGFSPSYIEILERQMRVAELQIEKAETGDNVLNTFINIEKQAIEKLRDVNNAGVDFYEAKSQMEKQLGFTIDVKRCSVIEYYSYIKTLEKDAKRTGS